MAYPTQRRLNEKYLIATGSFTVSAGGTISVAAPGRGEIKAIYLSPADGGAMTGSAVLTVSVENISVGTFTLPATAAGFASGGDTSFSPRAFVVDGDIIKLVLAVGLTNGTSANFTIVLTERTA